MLVLIATTLLTVTSQDRPTIANPAPQMKLVRVFISPTRVKENGPLSVMVPAGWGTGLKRELQVTPGGTYEDGSFGLEVSDTNPRRIGFSVTRMIRPPAHLRFEESIVRRSIDLADKPIKVGDYYGNLLEFVMFPKDLLKIRTKYDVLLRRSNGEFLYASMQSYGPKAREADKKLFLEMVASIQVPQH